MSDPEIPRVLESVLKWPTPPPETDLYSYLQWGIRSYPNKIALVEDDSGYQMTYSQLETLVTAAARGLRRHGFSKGDVIMFYSNTCWQYVVLMLATFRLGGIIAGINKLSTAATVHEMCVLCKPAFLFTDPQLAERASKAAHGTSVQSVICSTQGPGCVGFPSLTDSSSDLTSLPDLASLGIRPTKDVAFIMFSSGTTGLPKAVQLSHYNLILNYHHQRIPGMIRNDETVLHFLPLSHVYGCTTCLCNIGFGFTIILFKSFNLQQYVYNIAKYKITKINLVPPIAVQMTKSTLLDDYDVSSVTSIMCSAAPLAASVSKTLLTKFGHGAQLSQVWGMTEVTGAATSCFTDDSKRPPHIPPVPQGSVGLLLPGYQAKVVDLEKGKTVGVNENGEILLRGPQIMLGYLGNPEASRQTIDRDGWLHTGDLGHYDQNGYFFIADRLKEMIKYKGYQVAPAELEALLQTHPCIQAAGVVGIPDQEAGEIPHAWVIRTSGSSISETDVMDFVKDKVASYQRLRGGVTFVESIPTSPSGKILRKDIRAIMQQREYLDKSKL